MPTRRTCFRPLAGVNYKSYTTSKKGFERFGFRPLAGVNYKGYLYCIWLHSRDRFRPLAGVNYKLAAKNLARAHVRFRPLAGVNYKGYTWQQIATEKEVSVPLRG